MDAEDKANFAMSNQSEPHSLASNAGRVDAVEDPSGSVSVDYINDDSHMLRRHGGPEGSSAEPVGVEATGLAPASIAQTQPKTKPLSKSPTSPEAVGQNRKQYPGPVSSERQAKRCAVARSTRASRTISCIRVGAILVLKVWITVLVRRRVLSYLAPLTAGPICSSTLSVQPCIYLRYQTSYLPFVRKLVSLLCNFGFLARV